MGPGHCLPLSTRFWALWPLPRKNKPLTQEAIEDLVRCNPWIESFLDVQRDRVVNQQTGSMLRILSSDAHTSHGVTPDFHHHGRADPLDGSRPL